MITFFQQPDKRLQDWLWLVVLPLLAVFCWRVYGENMDDYEVGILYLSAISMGVMGFGWRSLQGYLLASGGLSLWSISLYNAVLERGDTVFGLKYLLSSQSAIMWMSALFVLATAAYFLGWWWRSEFTLKTATALTWSANTMGLTGLLVRWHESYLIAPDVGHIPVSNLYEVFVLFAVLTALLYLHYEKQYKTRVLGGFVMLIVSAAVAFLLWYAFEKQAHEIQPLVPALQSYWMKIHVPANFVGYGCFALSAMVGVAWLLRHHAESIQASADSLLMQLPDSRILDDLMYKAIALGFAFFTIATILGAMWAAEAWGGYWSWDPKETWALIVWLNYAAWLHTRLTKGWRGKLMVWWAIIGLLITLFAFLGVNMFLSGLHSYGEL
jgi:cytochrome c-type biogenesis protein CcsB